jgi:hypothetical protein
LYSSPGSVAETIRVARLNLIDFQFSFVHYVRRGTNPIGQRGITQHGLIEQKNATKLTVRKEHDKEFEKEGKRKSVFS